MNNPFSLSFGKEPFSIISRSIEENNILSNFVSDTRESNIYMITGVRGSGKTVMLSSISNTLRNNRDWIVVDLTVERDMLLALFSELSNQAKHWKPISDTTLSLSFKGIGVSFGNTSENSDVTTMLDKLIQESTKRQKRILVTVDEVVSNSYVREFVSQFQVFLRKNYNIFLLLTGLYDNINNLQNEKTLTFLYRAPRVEMKPLSIREIADSYREIFALKDVDALNMAKETMGYAYAYQILGFLCYKYNKHYSEVTKEFESYLWEYVYEKIWSESSDNDIKVLKAMAGGLMKVEDIRKEIQMSSNAFSVYRKRLLRRGIVYASSFGHLSFSLPHFREFVIDMTL